MDQNRRVGCGGPSTIDFVRDTFTDICDTQPRDSPVEHLTMRNVVKCPHKKVTYYFRSTPGSRGKIGSNIYTLAFFIAACEWTRVSGVEFERVQKNSSPHFIIRVANSHEEREHNKVLARAFFWNNNSNPHVFVIWRKARDLNLQTLFLHQIGHILGFRHEHCFFDTEFRSLLQPDDEQQQQQYIVRGNEVDKKSIMSYDYVHSMKIMPASLSITDQLQARYLYHSSR